MGLFGLQQQETTECLHWLPEPRRPVFSSLPQSICFLWFKYYEEWLTTQARKSGREAQKESLLPSLEGQMIGRGRLNLPYLGPGQGQTLGQGKQSKADGMCSEHSMKSNLRILIKNQVLNLDSFYLLKSCHQVLLIQLLQSVLTNLGPECKVLHYAICVFRGVRQRGQTGQRM